jgi:hypothetical protein
MGNIQVRGSGAWLELYTGYIAYIGKMHEFFDDDTYVC